MHHWLLFSLPTVRGRGTRIPFSSFLFLRPLDTNFPLLQNTWQTELLLCFLRPLSESRRIFISIRVTVEGFGPHTLALLFPPLLSPVLKERNFSCPPSRPRFPHISGKGFFFCCFFFFFFGGVPKNDIETGSMMYVPP